MNAVVVHEPEGFELLPVFRGGEEIKGGSGKGVLAANGLQAWRHSNTGVRIVLFSAPGPLTSLSIAVGTIPVSDAGHPHTLEHIVFLGSHKYPSRGYLDTLANRSLADGTNAYTHVDHTVYEATTAGYEGLLSLLPCFLDHVLRPKINEATFASEVYCITGDAKETGVVFSEMHGRENTEDDLAYTALNSVLLGGTPLAFNSGGVCEHIRTLTNESIERYHADYYCGSNVTVIVGGNDIPRASLLSSVKPLLDDIYASKCCTNKKIPWHDVRNLTPLPPVTVKKVPFPCPDEDIGTVMIGWRGPPSSSYLDRTAVEILMEYLTATVSSPLRQEFVENEDPLASHVYFYFENFLPVSKVVLCFSGVTHKESDEDSEDGTESISEMEVDELNDMTTEGRDGSRVNDTPNSEPAKGSQEEERETMLTSGEFAERVMKFLKSIVDANKLPDGIDAVHLTIKRERESYLAGLEEDSHEIVPDNLLKEVIYSDELDIVLGSDVRGALERLDDLKKMDEAYWLDLLRKMLVDAPRFELAMVPDPNLANSLAERDLKLREERKASLGAKELQRIAEENEQKLASLKGVPFDAKAFPPVPSAMNIPRNPYTVTISRTPQYYAQSTSVATDFIHVTILLHTSSLSFTQRLVLPLISSLILNSDVALEDGTYISYSDNSYAITEVTVSTDLAGTFLGYHNGMASQCLGVHFAATHEDFSQAAALVVRTLFREEVTEERLLTVAKNLLSDATEEHRDPVSMMSCAATNLPYLECDSANIPNFALSGSISTRPLLASIGDEGNNSKQTKTCRRKLVKLINETLASLRRLPPTDVFIQIGARDPDTCHDEFAAVWKEFSSSYVSTATLSEVNTESSNGDRAADMSKLPISRTMFPKGLGTLLDGQDTARAIGISGAENCYLDVRVASDVYPGHADWAPLTVLTELLCRMEGPLSDAIRGSGLAYTYGVSNDRWRCFIRAFIEETNCPVSAWSAFVEKLLEIRSLMDSDADGTMLFDLDTAKAMTIFGLSSQRSTPEFIIKNALADSALGVPSSPLADKTLEESVETVTLKHIVKAFDTHITPLLKSGSRVAVLTCSPHLLDSLIENFGKCSHSIQFQACAAEELVPKLIRKEFRNLSRR